MQHAAILSLPSRAFAMEVRDGCNRVDVVVPLWSAILAYPATLRWKLIGLTGGLLAIQILNLIRLISLFYLGQFSRSLFYLGQFSRSAFEFAHLYLWETLIIIDAMVVFAFWTRRSDRS